MSRVGTKIADRYVIEAMLGAGGMGAVFRAVDERLGREVALKLLAAEHVGDANAVARMLREAQATAALEHDHIIPIYDVGRTEDGGAYLAMQLVEGQTLRARMAGEGLSHEEALRIVADVGDALAHAHDAGIVHRDVKPDNVMLRARDGRTLVLDFGIARFVEPDGDAHALTADGSFVGTPAYLAPEQARSLEVDGRADQFALAVMTWELLTGSVPWSGKTLPSIIASILSDEPEPLAMIAGVAPHVSHAVKRALSKDPSDRFPTMGEFVASLVDDGVPAASTTNDIGLLDTVQASGVSAAPSTPDAARSRRPLLLGLGVVAIAVAGAFALFAKDEVHEPAADPPPTTPAGVGLRDLPVPRDCSPEALQHYAEGILALHTGTADSARAAFIAAANADDNCAAAHLRRVSSRSWRDDDAAVQRSYRRALRFREALTERDRAVLDAFGVYHLDARDQAGLSDALIALTEEFPDDAEILRVAAHAASDPEDQLAWLHRALEIDPDYALAYVTMSLVHAAAGDMDAAYQVASECQARLPAAADCIGAQIYMLSGERRCSEILGLARARVRAQGSADDHLDMADALACAGTSREAVERELRAAAAGDWLPHEHRARGIDLAFYFGDLAEAERLAMAALELEDLPTTTRTNIEARLVEALWEQGRDDEARARAVTQLRTLDGASEYLAQGWFPAADHVRVFQLARTSLAAEEMSRLFAGFEDELGGQLYLGAFDTAAVTRLGLVETRADALAGLARLPPSSGRLSETTHALHGRALLLADRPDEAAEVLSEVTGSCHCLQLPLWRLRSHLWRAEALAATGDLEGACASARFAYDAWNASAPTSRIAAASRAFLERCE